MASKFRKFLKRSAPSIKKLEPQFVAKNKTLTKLASASIMRRAITQNQSIAKAPDWSDTKSMRENLRAQHETQTTPFSRTSDKIRRRDRMPPGAERDLLTEDINKETLKRGHVGIAVGAVAVGGAGGAAIGAGGKAIRAGDAAAAVRDNPAPGDAPFSSVDTWPDPSDLPDVSQQIYRQRPIGAPISQQRRQPGLISGLLRFFHRILVPVPARTAAEPAVFSQPARWRVPLPGPVRNIQPNPKTGFEVGLPPSPMDSSRLPVRYNVGGTRFTNPDGSTGIAY